jgi:hypothetical protein
MITTALIYSRVSSDEQKREGLSLDAHLADCRRYAARPGWVIGPEFQDVVSGKRDDRPHYPCKPGASPTRTLAGAPHTIAARAKAGMAVGTLL